MKQTITPEQFTENTDAPSVVVDFPYRFIRMPFSDEAGGFVVVKVPENWDKKLKARVTFSTNGECETAGAVISCNFQPYGPTNNAMGAVTADVTGATHQLIESNTVEIDCSSVSGHSIILRVGPDISTSTADAPVDIATVELYFGTY